MPRNKSYPVTPISIYELYRFLKKYPVNIDRYPPRRMATDIPPFKNILKYTGFLGMKRKKYSFDLKSILEYTKYLVDKKEKSPEDITLYLNFNFDDLFVTWLGYSDYFYNLDVRFQTAYVKWDHSETKYNFQFGIYYKIDDGYTVEKVKRILRTDKVIQFNELIAGCVENSYQLNKLKLCKFKDVCRSSFSSTSYPVDIETLEQMFELFPNFKKSSICYVSPAMQQNYGVHFLEFMPDIGNGERGYIG